MAELFAAIWLPTLVAAVVVFLASWVMHTLLPLHKSDYARIPDEQAFLEAVRSAGATPGQYSFPHMSGPDAMKDPETVARYERGPVGALIVGANGMPNMGRLLGQHFLYCLLVSFLAGYVGHAALGNTADYLAVFRIVGTTAFMAYAVAHISAAIWFFQSWSMTVKYLFDGLVYGLLTAGVFGWLWPT